MIKIYWMLEKEISTHLSCATELNTVIKYLRNQREKLSCRTFVRRFISCCYSEFQLQKVLIE